MPERTLTSDELKALLERFSLERAGERTFEEVAEAQVQLLTAKIAALTDMLRGSEANDTVHLASRMLLGDLAAIAAHFRGRVNAMRSPLAKALADLRDVRYESTDAEPR
jgi:hypothetical protein